MAAPVNAGAPPGDKSGRGRFAAVRRHAATSAFRLLWAGSVILPALALVLGSLSVWNGLVRSKTEEMVRILGMTNEQTLRMLETQNAVLAALEAHIEGMSWADITLDPALRRFIRSLSEATPTVRDIGIVAPDGHLAVSSDIPEPSREVSLSDRDYVRAFPPGAVAGRIYVSELLAGRFTGQMHVHLSRARRGPDGRADGGVLIAAFAPAYFERFFAEVAETAATGFLLMREDGRVLARYPIQVAGPGEHLEQNDPVLAVARATKAGAPAQVMRSGSLLDRFRLLAVRRAGNSPLLIVHSIDPDLVRQAWLRQVTPLAIGALAAMAWLMLLTAQVQDRLAAERESLVRRTVAAERGQAEAQTRAELEARQRQTEKVAALGQLAAGVAHDFNNLLQSILISAEALTAREPPPAEEVHDIGALILRVAERGMALTRRMLDYARRDDQPGGDTDVAASLRGVRELLARSLGPTYRLHLDLGAAAGLRARGHPAEFETVVINLVVNARDAMPEGGEIGIVVTEAEATDPRLPDGRMARRYVRIAIIDNGHGMDQASLARAGEAFFTTKPRGQGTGLGLSMARGFARRCGGRLDLASAPGQGTTVTLWLPAA